MKQLIDTHAHLNLEEFSGDWKEVIDRTLENGVFMINVGVNYVSSARAVEIAGEFAGGVWAAIGLHPDNIAPGIAKSFKAGATSESVKEPEFNAAVYRQLARSSAKVVAIGEIGLDYSRLPKNEIESSRIRDKQADIFRVQLELARELGLPVIIHSRKAHKDVIRVLREFAGMGGTVPGVVHCFTGTTKEARQYYELGLHFGLNGIIFKIDLDDAVAQMPSDRILLETDCPYLLPLPEIGRNEPVYIKNVAERVAQIRNDSTDTILEVATANAKNLFKI